jgi:eukaryotic-like serine/threonine-protein kinase
MSSTECEHPEDRLAEVLAAYDDKLAAGEEKPPRELEEAVDPALLADWNRLTAFLALLERAWPRSSADAQPLETSGADDETAVAQPPDGAGGRFGRFQILRPLGQGGFGIVFLAWDPVLRRKIALKVPQPESVVTAEARRRFLLEAHAAAGLDHPNIIPVYETGSVGAVNYIAAAYCLGPTLAAWLARQDQPAPPRAAAALVATLARAIEHAHERGVLHRDLKPTNILLQRLRSGEPGCEEDRSLASFQPRITDFSLAKVVDGDGPEARSGAPFGSPPYMAPEQAQGRLRAIGPPTDVYGLGCILYELLAGEPPFRGKNQLETLRQVIADDPIPARHRRPEVPAVLDGIVLKCLEKDPSKRYPSARALAEELERFLAGDSARVRPNARWEQITRRANRHLRALVVVTVAMCTGVVFVGAAWLKTRLDESRQIARRWQDETRRRDLVARRAWYAADIHLADKLLRAHETDRAVELLSRHRPGLVEDDLREFTWHFLSRRCADQTRGPTGHEGAAESVALGPFGRTLGLAFSADSRTAIAVGADGIFSTWDVETGALRDPEQLEKASATALVSVAPIEAVRAFESLSHQALAAGQREKPTALAISPDGKSLASGYAGGTVRLWEVAAGLELLTLEGHIGPIRLLRFSPDGKTLAACAEPATDRSMLLLWRTAGE